MIYICSHFLPSWFIFSIALYRIPSKRRDLLYRAKLNLIEMIHKAWTNKSRTVQTTFGSTHKKRSISNEWADDSIPITYRRWYVMTSLASCAFAHSIAAITYINWHAHAVSTDFVNHFYRISTCFFPFFLFLLLLSIDVVLIVVDNHYLLSYCVWIKYWWHPSCYYLRRKKWFRAVLTNCYLIFSVFVYLVDHTLECADSEMMTYLLAMPFRFIEAIFTASWAIEIYFYDEDLDMNHGERRKYLVIKSNKMEIMAKESISGRCTWTRMIISNFCWFPQVECTSAFK